MLLNSNPNSFFIPDFVEIQRKSFLDLLEKGLINEIKKRNFISTPTNDVQLIFYPDYYQLNPPEWTPKQAILNSKSYTCRLYVPAQLINNLTKEVNLQWILLGNLPLMTKRGHFIINGSPRVIINQMVRSPGIYYQETIDKNKKRSYYADLISHRGTWLRLEIDKKQRVWARMKKTPKVSILIFLQSMGLTKERIFQSIHYSNFLKNSFLKQNNPISTEQALIALYSKTHPKKDKTEITPEMGHKFLFRKFMNPRTYDLGKLGRIQLNKKLGLSIPLNIYTLTPQDILFAVDYLINLEHGLGSIDDIDHLKNRRVRASGELVQNQLGTGLIRLEKMIREKLKKPKKNLTIRSLITTKPLNGALREFFGSSPLSQFMDQTNPLAEITHKRRLSSLGPGGVSRETAGMAVRGIHPSHYGRICPIETPEGPNAGLVNSITTYAKINSEGFLETPFYNVSQGQIQKDQGPVFFSAEHEENLNVAPGDLKTNILNFLPKKLIPIRNSEEFKIVSRDQVHYIAISPIQMISIATSLIPFLEHDDANRALMGSNMQRQAVPLIAPERPVIGTGLEARVVSDSGHILQAETSGFVSYVSSDKIVIHTFFPIKSNLPEIPISNNLHDARIFDSTIFDGRMLTLPFTMVEDSNRVLLPQRDYQEDLYQGDGLFNFKRLTQSDTLFKSIPPPVKKNPDKTQTFYSKRIFAQKNLHKKREMNSSQIFYYLNLNKKRKLKTNISLLNSHLLIKDSRIIIHEEKINKKIYGLNFPKLKFNSTLYDFINKDSQMLINENIKFLLYPVKKIYFPLGTIYDGRDLYSSQKFFLIFNDLQLDHKIKNTSIFNEYNSSWMSIHESKFSFGIPACLIQLYSNKNFSLGMIKDGRELHSSPLFSNTLWSILQKPKRFCGNNWQRKIMQFEIFQQKESFNSNFDLKILCNLGWDPNDFQKICLINKKSIFNTNLVNSWIQNKNYYFLKKANNQNKRGFFVFNFKYKIHNHFVELIRTSELISFLMCQTNNILNFSNTSFYRQINKPNFLGSKNALQISLFWQFLDNRSKFSIKNKKTKIIFNHTNLLRESTISKKNFFTRIIILNSQKIYFQSILKNFLFSFFNKKLTSFCLRPWNSFFYLFYSQNKTFFFFPISKNLKYYSFYYPYRSSPLGTIIDGRELCSSQDGKPFKSPLGNLSEVRELDLSQNVSGSKSSKFIMTPQDSNRREKRSQLNVFLINKNLVGIKSNSKIQTVRNTFILKYISSKRLPSISLIAQKKSKKYDAFLNKKFIFKDKPYWLSKDSSDKCLPTKNDSSWIKCRDLKRPTFNITAKKRSQFEYSGILSPSKFSWFPLGHELDSSQKGFLPLIITKDFRMLDHFPLGTIRDGGELCSSQWYHEEMKTGDLGWQSLRNLKRMNIRKSNTTKTKKLLDLFPNSSWRSIRESLVTSPISYNSIVYSLQNYQRSNQDTCLTQTPVVYEGEWIQKGDLLADGAASVKGELALGKNILIGYMPWEGYNFEDAILINERLIYDDIYTSIHIERYEVEIRDTKFGVEQITNQIPEIDISEISHLDKNGISKIGTWVKEGDILVGKVTPIQKKLLSPHEKLLYDIVGKDIPTTRDTSLRLPKSVEGRVINIQVLETENIPPEIAFEGPGRVHIYVAEKRKIQVGDKMAGRHGNKGIVSKILPRQDMPYLPDGTPIDMVLNPLGVPSRMNVGQVFECLLGLAGKYLGQQFKIVPFDEIYGPEASRSLVYSKLFDASLKTGQDWLFNPNFPAKTKLFDGRTGECFEQAVTIGQAYMLKLVHLVDEKIHARSTGPYSLVTQQPLRGRSKHGGQRLGEMEVWALEGFGAAYTLQELLTVKSDDMKGRHQVMDAILNNKTISLGTPESFKVLIRELQSLCLDVGVYSIDSTGHRKQIDVMKLP